VKTCRGCDVTKPLSEFYTNPNVHDGHLNWCKPCIVARYSEGRKKRQREVLAYIQQIKLERGCMDCGYRDNAVALDFDHLPGHTKEYRIATMAAGLKRSKIDAEIAKCEVVCANCHRIRTHERLQREEQANG
jgi:hypothetical protein